MRTEAFIHPSAVVEPGARIGAGAHIGPLCYVGGDAAIGAGSRLVGHVTVMGATTLGENCVVYPQAVLGGPPQNVKHRGGRTTLTIGNNCTIREGVTMHCGTDSSRGATTVGDNGMFLAQVHIAHDCVIGDNVIMANLASLGGHCEIGDNVNIGGMSGVHQFVRIGHHAFLAAGAMVVGDVIPYAIAWGNRARLRGLNVVGMKRSGMPRTEIMALRRAYLAIFDRSRPVPENIEIARVEFAGVPAAMDMIDFIAASGKRHYAMPSLQGGSNDADDDES